MCVSSGVCVCVCVCRQVCVCVFSVTSRVCVCHVLRTGVGHATEEVLVAGGVHGQGTEKLAEELACGCACV